MENHLQFQADQEVLHNSYALHGIRKNDHMELADTKGKPYLHVSMKSSSQPVKIFAYEASCLDNPVELTSACWSHTFSLMLIYKEYCPSSGARKTPVSEKL
ncbi:Hypothetical predicted protein, partial [Marmota monax]